MAKREGNSPVNMPMCAREPETGHKECITAGTLSKIEEVKRKKLDMNNSWTRLQKIKSQKEYTDANKEVKKSIKRDKK